MVIAANPALAKARNTEKASGKAKRKTRSRDSRAVEADAGEHSLGILRIMSAKKDPCSRHDDLAARGCTAMQRAICKWAPS